MSSPLQSVRHVAVVLTLLMAAACHRPVVSSPPPGAASQPIAAAESFAVIGDYGVDNADEAAVARLVHDWHPAYIVTVGDNNYPHGKRATIDANIGKYYGDYIRFDPNYRGSGAQTDSQKPQRFFPTLGNHDWYSGEGALPYTDYFNLPGNERYYQVRRGTVDIFAIDSDEHEPDGISVDSKQAQWLKNALTQSTAHWKLVFMHHPPYSRGEHGDNVILQWPYRQWGAHAVVAGHDHDYERIILEGCLYLVVGTGGAELRGFNSKPYPTAVADVMYADKHGAMRVDVTDAALTFRFYNVDGALIDTYVLNHP